MSEYCDRFTCNTGNTLPFPTYEKTNPVIQHSWNLKFTMDSIELADIKRTFKISTSIETTSSCNIYTQTLQDVAPCEPVSNTKITPYFNDKVVGNFSIILYADFENHVYLLNRIYEDNKITASVQNPFEYLMPYGKQSSVAYFPILTQKTQSTYELWIQGVLVKQYIGMETSNELELQPLVFPMPSSDAYFFIGAPGYEWMINNFFYWYNDPSDIGWPPCFSGQSSSLGMTGFSKAESDGGKDFFYPPWIRDNVFLDFDQYHRIYRAEAADRFINLIGGVYSEVCGAAFTKTYDFIVPNKQDIIGNYIKIADLDFYSFYLPEIKEAINNIGNPEITQAFLSVVEGADVCFPICIS